MSLQLFVNYFQGVTAETLDLFGVRVTSVGSGLLLPVYSFTGTLVGVKVISAVEETDSAKAHTTTRTIPRFGSSVVNIVSDSLSVLMAIFQVNLG